MSDEAREAARRIVKLVDDGEPLRDLLEELNCWGPQVARAYLDANDEIERLRAIVKAYEEGARISKYLKTYPSDQTLSGCHVCGLGSDGKPMAYNCQRNDCPTRATCIVENT